MKLVINMIESDIGYSIYREFKKRSGSSNIAKPPAIESVLAICDRIQPTRILELGAGIGTITYALLRHTNATIDVYEPNDFCAQELTKNLEGFEERYSVIDSYRTMPPSRSYEFVIVDGGNTKDHEHGYSEAAWLILSYIDDSLKSVYIEGNRDNQRRQTRKALSTKGIYTPIRLPHKLYDNKRFNSGHEIRFSANNSKLLQLINHMFWESVLFIKSTFHKIRG